jgi:hypothetical protein
MHVPQPAPAALLLTLAAALSACTLIPMQPGAEQVIVADESKVAGCEARGATNVSVIHEVGGFNRLPDVVADELARLASNTAVDMGGDTLVPQGPVVEGKRKFAIYKCRKDAAATPGAKP